MSTTYKTWSGSRGNRLPDTDYPCGYPIHVTICTVGSRRFFKDPELAKSVLEPVAREGSTLAYCLMPDHLHWLLRCARHDRQTVERIKSLTTRISWRFGSRGQLWQRSYHDRVVRRWEDLLEVARYIVANPVRAGLVDEVDAYPHQIVYEERMGVLR